MAGHSRRRQLILAGILVATAFILPRQESAAATLDGKLTHATAGITEAQGWPVSISRETAVIRAPFADAGGTGAGASYVFVRTPGSLNWTEQAQLLPIVPHAFDDFGRSVAVSGDTAVVGAPGWDSDGDLGENCGTAYVFERNGSSWTQLQPLFAHRVDADGWFGAHVAIDEDYIIVGQPYCGLIGCADVDKHPPGMRWVPEAERFPLGGGSSERFGWSVDIPFRHLGRAQRQQRGDGRRVERRDRGQRIRVCLHSPDE